MGKDTESAFSQAGLPVIATVVRRLPRTSCENLLNRLYYLIFGLRL